MFGASDTMLIIVSLGLQADWATFLFNSGDNDLQDSVKKNKIQINLWILIL